jgi:hypothetical protein
MCKSGTWPYHQFAMVPYRYESIITSEFIITTHISAGPTALEKTILVRIFLNIENVL